MTDIQLFNGESIQRKLRSLRQLKREIENKAVLTHYNTCERKAYYFDLDEETKDLLLKKFQEGIDKLEAEFEAL